MKKVGIIFAMKEELDETKKNFKEVEHNVFELDDLCVYINEYDVHPKNGLENHLRRCCRRSAVHRPAIQLPCRLYMRVVFGCRMWFPFGAESDEKAENSTPAGCQLPAGRHMCIHIMETAFRRLYSF